MGLGLGLGSGLGLGKGQGYLADEVGEDAVDGEGGRRIVRRESLVMLEVVGLVRVGGLGFGLGLGLGLGLEVVGLVRVGGGVAVGPLADQCEGSD